MVSDIISKPVALVLMQMTHEPRLELAVTLAVKDWLRLRLTSVTEKRVQYEEKYGMTFELFKAALQAGQIPNGYSYEVEKDYWEWEGTITDEEDIREMGESLP